MEQKSGKRTKRNVDSIDIIEVCSQPRVTLAAEKIGGVRPGASLSHHDAGRGRTEVGFPLARDAQQGSSEDLE